MHIGIAGTGKMGAAMARRLLGCQQRVTVWNRTRDKAEPLLALGAQWAATPAELAGAVDLVISMVTDERALDEVYSGPQGLLAGTVKGKLLIDMSTVQPATQQRMAARVAAAGAAYLECPVGGSVGPAQEGKLLGFVGGNSSDLERAREVLNQLCRRVEHVGPHGAGATMKLAINLPLMVYWQTLGEALSLIQPLGLDPARVVEIFAETSGGPNMLKVRGPMIAQALSGAKSPQVTVDVATMRKDMNAMLAQAKQNGRELPLTALALGCFERAAGAGLDQSDCTQLPVWWLESGGKHA